MNRELDVPKTAVFMQTNRDYRLSSLNGFVVNFKANEPTRVPPQCYVEAIGAGAIECEDQPEPEVVDDNDGGPRGSEKAGRLEAEARDMHVSQAIIRLLDRGDNTDFKADGYPKVAVLMKELPPECPRPSATDIQRIFDQLRDNVDLVDDD